MHFCLVTNETFDKAYLTALLCSSLSDSIACPVYKVTNENGDVECLESIPYAMMYRYRGKELSCLSRYEYFTNVKVIKVKASATNKKSTRGRKKNRQFAFDNPNILIRLTHFQVLRSKQCTLKLVRNPPPHPGPKPADKESAKVTKAWQKRADRFALFYLLLMRPETALYSHEQENKYRYNWSEFVTFVQELKHNASRDKAPEIDKKRYITMKTFAHGWYTSPRDRAILKLYRNRNRTIWTDDERKHHNRLLGRSKDKSRRELDDLDLLRCLHEGIIDKPQLSAGTQRRILSQMVQGNNIAEHIRVFGRSLPDTEAEVPGTSAAANEDGAERVGGRCTVTTVKGCPKLAESIKSAKPSRELSQAPGPSSGEQTKHERVLL